jgi:hypothetical protein
MPDKYGRPTFDDGLNIASKAAALGSAVKKNELDDARLREIEANSADKEYKNQALRILSERDNGDTYNSDINARMETAIPSSVMVEARKEYKPIADENRQNRIDDYSIGFIDSIKRDGVNAVSNVDFKSYGSNGKDAYQGYLKALQYVNTEMEAQNGFTDKRMKSAASGYDQLQKGIYGISNGNQPEDVKKTALMNLVNNSNTPYRASVNENGTIDLYYNEYSNIDEPKIVADDISFEDAMKRVGSIGFTEYASMHGASMQAAAQNNLNASPITFKNSNGDTMTAYKRTNPENVNEFELVTFDKDGNYTGVTSLDVLNESGWRKVDPEAEMKTNKAKAEISKTNAETALKKEQAEVYRKYGKSSKPAETSKEGLDLIDKITKLDQAIAKASDEGSTIPESVLKAKSAYETQLKKKYPDTYASYIGNDTGKPNAFKILLTK